MVSQGGNFELGFFSPGNSRKYYMGIWYKNVSMQTIVWVANRERPIFNTSSSELKLSKHGTLILVIHSKTVIWSSNSILFGASDSTIAVLLDDGNLVIKDDSGSHVSWQSFDHPTHAWLPGAKLGFDKFSRENRLLTSWRSSEDPSPGRFSAEVNPNGTIHFFLLMKGQQYWPSGTKDIQLLTSSPEVDKFYSFSYVGDVNESYITYSVRAGCVLSNCMLDFTGQMKRRIWNNDTKKWVLHCLFPTDPCDVHTLCGPFGSCSNYSSPSCECLQGFETLSIEKWNLGDYTGGCVRRAPFAVWKERWIQEAISSAVASQPQPLAAGSAEECEVTCLNNCSCVAYSYDNGCLIWNGEILNLKRLSDSPGSEGGSGVLYIRLAASELVRPDYEKRQKYTVAIFSSVAGDVADHIM